MYNTLKIGVLLVITDANKYIPFTETTFYSLTGFFALLAFITFCYPLAGFLADVWCGYYRMVSTCLAIIWSALLLLTPGLLLVTNIGKSSSLVRGFEYFLVGGGLLLLIPGLSGFYSNIVQLSLDQLLEVPSHILGVFLHWSVWIELLGEAIIHIITVVAICLQNGPDFRDVSQSVTYIVPGSLLVVLSFILIFNCFTKRWFVVMDTQYNPYKMVLNVLRYVRSHKDPVRHSALHWTNGEPPSRFDFAKQCYGGPFTSNQVEDVKTLGRVVCVLVSVGPIFVLTVPTSYLIFPFFTMHAIGNNNTECSVKFLLVSSGTIGYLVALVCIPLVIWCVYCVLKNRVPKILTRLEIGMILSTLGVLSMLLIDFFGHTFSENSHKNRCMFTEKYFYLDDHHKTPHVSRGFYALGLPWYVMLVPNALNVLSYHITLASTLEFVSAQAPQPMKGLLFGVMFAIKGGFNLLGTTALIPFSIKLWSDEATAPSFISCGFGYLFVSLMVAVIGLILFSCASKRYKYRVRDEEPFPQSVVEEIYERRLQHNDDSESDDSIDFDPERATGNHGDDDAGSRGNSRKRVRFADEVMTEESLSLSHNWYGTFQRCSSDARTPDQ